MARQVEPRSGLAYGFQAGDDMWGDDMNANLELLALTGTQPRLSGTAQNTPPSSPTHGDIYTVGSSPTGAWAGWAQNSLAVWTYAATAYTLLGWRNIVPKVGWVMDDGANLLRYNGTSWAAVGGSTATGLTTVTSDATLTGDGTGTSALRVTNPFTADDETKLDGITAGAQPSYYRGNWIASRAYVVGNIVKSALQNEYYICHTAHTSTVANGIDGVNWRDSWRALTELDITSILSTLSAPAFADEIPISDVSSSDNIKDRRIRVDALLRAGQADWNQNSSTDPRYIHNKPTSLQGPQGPQGIQGRQGIQGPKGDKGDKGDPGTDGTDGTDGDRGPRGLQGIQGPRGNPGPKGDKGDPGTDGTDGTPGTRGPAGPNPFKGTWTVGTAYVIGDIVRLVSRYFICHAANTAALTNQPYSRADWRSTWRPLTFPDVGELSLQLNATQLADNDRFVVSDESTTGDFARFVTFADLKTKIGSSSAGTVAGTIATITRQTNSGTIRGREGMGMVGTASAGIIFGGNRGGSRGTYLNDFLSYTVSGGTTTITTLTKTGASISAREEMGMVGDATSGVIFGGSARGTFNDFYKYDVTSGSVAITALTKAGATIASRHDMGMIGDATSGIIFGGASGSRYYSDFYSYAVSGNTVTLTALTKAGASISAREEMGMVGSETAGIIFGGWTGSADLSDFYSYSIAGGTVTLTALTKTGATIAGRRDMGMIGSATSGVIFGGRRLSSPYDDFYGYSVAASTVSLTKLSKSGSIEPRSEMGMVGTATDILIFGGSNGAVYYNNFYKVAVNSGFVSVATDVVTDETLKGSGTDADPLGVANPFTPAEKTKLAGLTAGSSIYKGAWATDTAYTISDIVSHASQLWICTSGHTASAVNRPSDGTTTATWRGVWRNLTQVDLDSLSLSILSSNVADTDSVALFDASARHTRKLTVAELKKVIPRTSGGGGGSSNYKGAWAVGTAYVVGDIVQLVNRYFICHAANTAALTNQPYSTANWRNTWRPLTFPDVGELTLSTTLADDDRFVISDESTTGDFARYITTSSLASKIQTGYMKAQCITQTAYDALSPKDPNTIYFITGT